MLRIHFQGKWSLDVKAMGLLSLFSARISTAFALTRMETQSKERPCLLGLESLNVAFQVCLKLVYAHFIPVYTPYMYM